MAILGKWHLQQTGFSVLQHGFYNMGSLVKDLKEKHRESAQ